MLIHVPEVLTKEETASWKARLDSADWVDGKVTAGLQSAQVKQNDQLAEGSELARELGGRIIEALQQNALFVSAALPLHVFPPLFNRYRAGDGFGNHVDNSIRQITGTAHRIRTDLSATLYFSKPEDYEGGELVIEDTYGVHQVKLPAGDMVLYPSTSLHRVLPITNGARVSAFFWIQSMVRDDSCRGLLFDLDTAVQRLNRDVPGHPAPVQLTGVYHNLIRRWAEL